MSANGHAPIAFGKLCPCGEMFMPHREAERYCSNACAGRYGTVTLPAAAPVEKPVKPVKHEPPAPLAIKRMRRWVAAQPARP